MNFMLITNQPETASYAVECGVDIIFVDLEKMGKKERQKSVDSVKSSHSIDDIIGVKQAIGDHSLLVRVNPLYEGSKEEIDAVIEAGATSVMLPMFRSSDDVARFCDYIAGRASVVPLIETVDALKDIEALARMGNIDRFHFGLNDLHLAFKFRFMFEAMNAPPLLRAYDILKDSSHKYGIGGVARLDEGLLSGKSVLNEIQYHGGDAAILSRTFHRGSITKEQLEVQGNLVEELKKLKDHSNVASAYSQQIRQIHHKAFLEGVAKISASMMR